MPVIIEFFENSENIFGLICGKFLKNHSMVSLGILLTRRHRLISIAAMLDVFSSANRFSISMGKPACFAISLIKMGDASALLDDEYPVYSLNNAPAQSIILIPAFATEDLKAAIELNSEVIPWLCQQYMKGTEIASFCTGAFLLAATGLLNDKPATTHINAAEVFSKTFPEVKINSKAITTFESRIYTSGGATNSFYLMFQIIEKYCGREILMKVAKYFAIDLNRKQQSYFSTFRPVTDHSDELVKMVQQRMDAEYNELSTVEEFLNEIPASRRNLVRRFKGATGLTPIEYLQRTRMEAAKKILENTNRTILDVMLEVGYNDLKTFRLLFKKYTGLTPTEYREKFMVKSVVRLESLQGLN